jgi:hypothetical protein
VGFDLGDFFQPVTGDPGATEIAPFNVTGNGFVVTAGFIGLVVIINII